MPTREELRALATKLYGTTWQTRTARLLGVATRTLRRWIAGGDIPSWVIDRLEAALAARETVRRALGR